MSQAAFAALFLTNATATRAGIRRTPTAAGAVSGSISKADGTYAIPAGFHNGKGAVRISSEEQAKLVSGNIKSGVTVLGISGKSSVVDTSDATAAAGTIVSGKTAYINGTKVTGSLTTVSVSQDSLTKILTVE